MTEKKHSKSEAEYGEGKPQHHCGHLFSGDTHYCRHFLTEKTTTTGHCDIVAGSIRRDAGCKFFERV